jgi:dihydropteroate synthase
MPDKPFSLMGIVNVTPDSFFDGGKYFTPADAVEQGKKLFGEGAAILDIGGASSRPGALPVPAEEEIDRVIPVVRRLSADVSCPISVDTTSALVARRALQAGATWINDISAGRQDPSMAAVAAEYGCTIVLMHSRATPRTMQEHCDYTDVVAEVKQELLLSVKPFESAGVAKERIVLDPGIGFAKTVEQNLALLAGLDAFVATGYRVMVGTSRKSFIGHLTGNAAGQRLYGTLGSVAAAFLGGARLFRVHDVAATREFLTVFCAVQERATAVRPAGNGRTRDDIRQDGRP